MKIKNIIARIISVGKNIITLNADVELNINKGKHIKLYSPHLIEESTILDYTYIAPNSNIKYTTIGKFCSIGPNFHSGVGIHPTTMVSTSPCFYSTKKQCGYTFAKTNKIQEHKNVYIGHDVFIGANVLIMGGIKIGSGAIVAAGAVVTKDVPPYAIVGGVPAKIIKYRFDNDIVDKLLKVKWWELKEEKLEEIEPFMHDANALIEYLSTKQMD